MTQRFTAITAIRDLDAIRSVRVRLPPQVFCQPRFLRQIGDRVLIFADVDMVAHLTCAGLCINSRLPAQSGVRAAQDLKAGPTQLRSLQHRLNIPPPNVVSTERCLAGLRRKEPRGSLAIRKKTMPLAKERLGAFCQANLPLGTCRFR